MLKISNIKISVKHKITNDILMNKCSKILKCNRIHSVKIVKKSIDARDKNDVHYNISVEVNVDNEQKYLKLKNVSQAKSIEYTPITESNFNKRPIIIGFGPAGMFAGLTLARAGAKPIIFERGYAVEDRQKAIDKFWSTGVLDTKSNVQFGEGGAGTFSDGKLTTGIKDVRCQYVLKELVKFGAPNEIMYEAKPHIGTDKLINIVRNIREEIISLGGEIHFDSRVSSINVENGVLKSVEVNNKKYDADNVILAIGHSARDTFEELYKKGVDIIQKSFSMGVRIEHSQDMINKAQYGEFAKYLPAADYKLVAHLPNGRSAYTFCMCPGGVVVAAASEEKRVVTNGMSYYKRDKENANAALLIGVNTTDFGSDYPLAGMELQRKIEGRAFKVGGSNYNAPAQKVGDFIKNVPSEKAGKITPSYKPSVKFTDIRKVFPNFINESIGLALTELDKKIKGFASDDAVMTAVESRSSSPVRITRGDNYMSTNVKGLYPCGEGCGYAGGIMSAAVDGVRCAEALLRN